MCRVIGPEQYAAPWPPVRWSRSALCVLGLLVGLLGMHALAPGGSGPDHAHEHPVAATAAEAHGVCFGDGHGGGGHARHADATCASAAVAGAPELPALVPDPVSTPVSADAVRPYAAVAPDGARAPPSLAELQLLRI
ncbi:DUF6153 family protein [Streptomyces sp. NPDC018693]|uniref:DUF6153 family protein n=1 Tax=unclassified Streptomyces TaxID=2593676 RepID=UPI0037A01E10